MNGSLENSVDELTVHDASPDQNECCGNHGICSHQVLGDETPKPIANSAYKMVTRKVILPQFIFFLLLKLRNIATFLMLLSWSKYGKRSCFLSYKPNLKAME
jgi:hypothetical protein